MLLLVLRHSECSPTYLLQLVLTFFNVMASQMFSKISSSIVASLNLPLSQETKDLVLAYKTSCPYVEILVAKFRDSSNYLKVSHHFWLLSFLILLTI